MLSALSQNASYLSDQFFSHACTCTFHILFFLFFMYIYNFFNRCAKIWWINFLGNIAVINIKVTRALNPNATNFYFLLSWRVELIHRKVSYTYQQPLERENLGRGRITKPTLIPYRRMPTKQRTMTLVRLRLHYELERNITPGHAAVPPQFTVHTSWTADRWPIRAISRLPRPVISLLHRYDGNAKRFRRRRELQRERRITSAAHWTKFSFNRTGVRNIDRLTN